MADLNFLECFCAKNRVTREEYAHAVFDRVVYRRVLWVKWLLLIVNRNHFAADFDLIYGVERLRRLREFTIEAERFNEHPANFGWLRRHLLMRVSTKRLRALIKETMLNIPAESETSPAVSHFSQKQLAERA